MRMNHGAMRAIALALVLGCGLVVGTGAQRAEAALIQFEVHNSPVDFGWVGGAGAAGFFSYFDGPGTHSFNLQNVHMLVDTATGFGTMQGSLIHNISGDPWRISASFTHIQGLNMPQGVPYDNMFNDLVNHSERQLLWGEDQGGMMTTEFQLNLETDLLNPAYAGPRNYIGKTMDLDGDGIGEPMHVLWNLWGNGTLGGSAWVTPTNQLGLHGGDFHFILTNPTNPSIIPEPMTSMLFGLGLVGSGLWTRRRKARSS